MAGFRCPGEFEIQSDVFVEWIPYSEPISGFNAYKSLVSIVKELTNEVNVHINCCPSVEGLYQECVNELKNGGVDVDKIHFTFFDADPDAFYFRDNGPNILTDDEGNTRAINTNWSFYGFYDPNDKLSLMSRLTGVHSAVCLNVTDIVDTDVVAEGGNRESNGQGVLMIVEQTEVELRNPTKSRDEIEKEYKRIFGAEKFIWIPRPMADDDDITIGPIDFKEDGTPVFGASGAMHTDEMARFIDESTILLAEVTDEEANSNMVSKENKKRLDDAYEAISKATDINGNPFKIVRIPAAAHYEFVVSPGDEMFEGYCEAVGDKFQDGTPLYKDRDLHLYAATSYCNFLICNGVVLGQRYWQEGLDEKIKEKDLAAQKILQECFPDRKVVMIDSLALNLCGGGVHCWTRNAYVPSN